MLRVRNRWITVWTLLISRQKSFDADLISKVWRTQFATPKFGTDWGLHGMNQWRCWCISKAAVPRNFSGKKRLLCTFTLLQQVAFPHPLTQKDGRSEPPSLNTDESLHSLVCNVQKSMQALKNVTAPPLTHYVSKDSVFTTDVSAGKCINARHALYCKFTWAMKYKLAGNLKTNLSHIQNGKATRAFSQTMV